MITIQKIDNLDREELREKWDELVRAMRFPTVFVTWEWIDCWSEIFIDIDQLFILLLKRENEIVGILPLYRVSPSGKGGIWRPKVLRYCGTSHLYPDHLDLICREKDEGECGTAVTDYLRENKGLWDIVDLPFLAEDSYLFNGFRNGRSSIKMISRKTSVAPYITLPGSYEDYLKSFSGKKRYTVNKKRRVLTEKQGAVYSECTGDVGKCVSQVMDLQGERAEKKNIVSTFTGKDIEAFHSSFAKLTKNRDWVRTRFLKIENEIIAGFYGFEFSGMTFFYQIGHKTSWEKNSPGLILLHETIREAIEHGNREYNLLQGNESYKRQLAKEYRNIYQLTLYNNSLSAMISRYMTQLKERVKKIVRRK